MTKDFFSTYLQYVGEGEVPLSFHRWSALAGLSALLERNIWLPFGHSNIHPNLYSMLIGVAGTRKSTAIKLMKKLLIQAGYTTIAAERTSKEKYFADLSNQHKSATDILDQTIFGDTNDSDVTTSLIAADEANDFFGINNIDFLSVLGSLWDWSGKYENKIKTGHSDWIPNPTITILSGNTPTGFSLAFPPAIIGQGFFSRLLLVYGEPTGKLVTFPKTPDQEETIEIIRLMQAIKQFNLGEKQYGPGAKNLIEKIYRTPSKLIDQRFASYYSRRLTHLLKLCLIVSAARLETTITETCVVQANTYLSYIENLMPKALGEFGKAKDSDVTHRVLAIISDSYKPIEILDVWAMVSTDLKSVKDLGEIIRNLLAANKIQSTAAGLLPVRKELDRLKEESSGLVAYNEFLTSEELGVSL